MDFETFEEERVNLNAGKLFEEYENGRDFDAIAEQAEMFGGDFYILPSS